MTPSFRLRASVATWALIATAFMSLAAGGFLVAIYIVLMMVGLGNMGETTRKPYASPETAAELVRVVAALTSAMVIAVVFLTTALAIRVKRRSAAAAEVISASCVTSATLVAAAAVFPLIRSATLRDSTLVVVVSAIIVWCAALAGTVPKASRLWTVVSAVVLTTMIALAYAFAERIR